MRKEFEHNPDTSQLLMSEVQLTNDHEIHGRHEKKLIYTWLRYMARVR